jgi:hypothetical protein
MNRPAIAIAALVVFAVAVINIALARNLILEYSVVEQRGAGVAWYLVWAMVLLTVLCGVALGAFLLGSAAGGAQRR